MTPHPLRKPSASSATFFLFFASLPRAAGPLGGNTAAVVPAVGTAGVPARRRCLLHHLLGLLLLLLLLLGRVVDVVVPIRGTALTRVRTTSATTTAAAGGHTSAGALTRWGHRALVVGVAVGGGAFGTEAGRQEGIRVVVAGTDVGVVTAAVAAPIIKCGGRGVTEVTIDMIITVVTQALEGADGRHLIFIILEVGDGGRMHRRVGRTVVAAAVVRAGTDDGHRLKLGVDEARRTAVLHALLALLTPLSIFLRSHLLLLGLEPTTEATILLLLLTSVLIVEVLVATLAADGTAEIGVILLLGSGREVLLLLEPVVGAEGVARAAITSTKGTALGRGSPSVAPEEGIIGAVIVVAGSSGSVVVGAEVGVQRAAVHNSCEFV